MKLFDIFLKVRVEFLKCLGENLALEYKRFHRVLNVFALGKEKKFRLWIVFFKGF